MDQMSDISNDVSYDVLYVMRSSLMKEDETEQWKNRRAAPITDIKMNSITKDPPGDSNSFCDENHTRIFASLVPDEIIFNIGDYSKRHFDASLLFGDVSGFTDLCEKYNKTGKGGPSRLTQVLNNYIGAMVQEIMSHGGDVLKFSGDAFIAMWKVTDNLSMRDAVHEALDCSLIIQKSYGRYQADVDVVIRVKLAVSAGHLVYSLIGNEKNSHYFGFGPPIMELKEAEQYSFAGDIIITRTAWQHVNANEYLAEELRDGLHIKVFGVGPNWRNVHRNVYNKEDTYSVLTAQGRLSLTAADSSSDDVSENDEDSDEENRYTNMAQIYASSDQYALRPAVNLAVRLKMKDDLKRFILAPVERGITADEPIEYLTEIRQVTVLFINCKVSYDMEPHKCIDIANKVYLAVTSLVTEKHGCLNKVNMFDKDLMLLIIFGLRGLKHEMESQTALKCAADCLTTLNSFPDVKGTSIGVTTGKTYCGAFGHTLRREYTVISLIVNKAARLMVAYPDKVTCDRETFLHSKLEPKNFILQEYKPLKGIVNPGPIYEYKKIARTRTMSVGVCARPLLGREQEIELYLHLVKLSKSMSHNPTATVKFTYFNVLVVHGESRQGKTRLLEELVYCTDSSIPIIRFNLTKADLEVPYTTIRLVFNALLRLNESSTVDERQTKLEHRLKRYPNRHEYCILNDIFNVQFPKTMNVRTSTPFNQLYNLKQVFKSLCQSCFAKYWVIAIDDSEFVDDSSWKLLDIIIHMNCAFIVTTMGIRSYISPIALEILKRTTVKVIQMKSIDKWYHVGLACQMLDVEAIPPELEKVIQLRSNGNPGWVESFLISLVQSGGLYIKNVTRKHSYDSGLIIPALYMMIRLTNEEIELWTKIMEEASSADDSTRWKMYVDSCRESYPDLTVAQTLRDKFDLFTSIKVCVLNPQFNIDDVEPELSMDVIILKTFDSLTSYEQLLLKCSAILGVIFPRAILMYIMSSSAVRLTALAVKKLFEIHVLSCAKGDFVEGGLIFKERLRNPNDDWSITCECRGLVIDDSCENLPKYASCGYMRFRSSTFRETTYNLLTDNQKREFHSKAIRYLEKETRRCRTCGNGYFSRYVGPALDHDLRTQKRKKTKHSLITIDSAMSMSDDFDKVRASLVSIHSRYSDAKYNKDAGSFKGNTLASFGFSPSTGIGDNLSQYLDTHHQSPEWFGFSIVRKYKNDFSLTRTFSDVDFTQCTCLLILTTMYSQLIEHCIGAGMLEKLLAVIIEYAYNCIDNQNVPQTLKVLEEGLQLLEGTMKLELEWMVDLKRGKLHTLLAYGRLKLRQFQEAYFHIKYALQCYGISFPTNGFTRFINSCWSRIQQKLQLYVWANSVQGSTKLDDDVAEYYNDVAETLTRLCEYYMVKNKWNKAKLAAMWSLKYALESQTDFFKMCICYFNMITVYSYFGQQSMNVALEVYAFRMCNKKRSAIEPKELRGVVRMYSAIFFARAVRSETEKALHIGYVLWRISASSHMMFILLTMLPMLIQIVLLKAHVIESGNMLREIMSLSHEDMDNSAKSWYYSLCISFHIHTGLIVESFPKCLTYCQGEGQEPTLRDPTARRRLYTAIWLWNVRNENWEGAFIWQEDAWSYPIRRRGENVDNLFSALYLLEGLIIYMVGKMDRKNIKAAEDADRRIKQLFKDLLDAAKVSKIILPRIYHLKAYYTLSKTNDFPKTLKLLRYAMKLAKNFGNEMEESWINHSQQAWCNKLPRNEMNFWRNHSEEENYVYFLDFDELADKIGHYTLPVPIYL